MKRVFSTFVLIFLFATASTFAQTEKETVVIIHTDKGDITVKLYNETPKHRDNFIKMIKSGWFNGSEFHRVINNFMIQGGESARGVADPGYMIDAEFLPELVHKKGALAAAREGDMVNPERKSSGTKIGRFCSYSLSIGSYCELKLRINCVLSSFPSVPAKI